MIDFTLPADELRVGRVMFWRTFTVALGIIGGVIVVPPGAHAQVLDDDRPESMPI